MHNSKSKKKIIINLNHTSNLLKTKSKKEELQQIQSLEQEKNLKSLI